MSKTRRKYGEGYIRETAAGTIEYRFRYTDEYGRRKYKSVSGVNEEHCYEREEMFLAELESKKNYIDYNVSIVKLMREEIEADYKKNYIEIKGYERNMQIVDMISRHSIGYIPICEINANHIELFYDYIKQYSNDTINKINSMLKRAFHVAEQKKIIDVNIMNDETIKKPKSNKPDRKVRGMTEEEQRRFVKALDDHKVRYGSNSYKLQFLIELYSGMRMGEINALKPEDINFDKGYVHVCRTVVVTRSNDRFVKDTTKTEAGERDVPISKQLEQVLRQALDEMKENPKGLIFYDHKKKCIISTTQVNSVFKTICRKAEVECYGQHSLRHTFATRCIEAEVPALTLKSWLGHKDIHVTLDTYADVFRRKEKGALSVFETHINDIMGGNQLKVRI